MQQHRALMAVMALMVANGYAGKTRNTKLGEIIKTEAQSPQNVEETTKLFR